MELLEQANVAKSTTEVTLTMDVDDERRKNHRLIKTKESGKKSIA